MPCNTEATVTLQEGCGIIAGMEYSGLVMVCVVVCAQTVYVVHRRVQRAIQRCQRYHQAHNVDIEESDSGGYQVVE
ncbi:MAG: hypothetical protein JO316_22585 [Abitibacteriaceae bacterium]|nr:hypothetical protein [Abditibacteriaceae bacterium]